MAAPAPEPRIMSMDCSKPFCLAMYNGQREMLRKHAIVETERNYFQQHYTILYNERTVNGDISTRTGQHVLPNGEVMKPETFMERTRMFNENKQTLERRVKELDDARRSLTDLTERLRQRTMRVRELEDKLTAFEKPREMKFTDDMHKQTHAENVRLKTDCESKSADIRKLKDTIKALEKSYDRRLTEDVCIPSTCPYGGCDESAYVRLVLTSADPGRALKNHIRNLHYCPHCKSDLKGTITKKHVDNCPANALKMRVPKKARFSYVQDDVENGTAEEQAIIRVEMLGTAVGFEEQTFVFPVTAAGLVDLSKSYSGLHCRFCHEGPYDSKHARGEHEDMCADVGLYPRHHCPCFVFSDVESMNRCYYWSIDPHRAWSHARRGNRRRVGEAVDGSKTCPLAEKPMPPGMIWAEVRKALKP